MKNKNLLKSVSGQSIVEFALIFPILIILLFGMIDLSRLIYSQTLLDHTAKNSLRIASVGNDINSISESIETSIKPLTGIVTRSISSGLDDEGNSCTKIILSPSSGYSVTAYITPAYTSNLTPGDTLRISLLYKLDYITPAFKFLGSTRELKAIYYSRMESSPD